MKLTKVFPLLVLFPILSCVSQTELFLPHKFNTFIDIKLYDGNKIDLGEIESIINFYDKASDNYLSRDITNVYTINQSKEAVEVDPRLYKLLESSLSVPEATYFNPLCGSLAKKWKEALANKVVLDDFVINEELAKINNTVLLFKDNNVIQKVGEAELDLGGIAKGYTLDIIHEYLLEKEEKNYLVNAGKSSILLGEKQSRDGLFSVSLPIKGLYFYAKNCFVSTSGISEQFEIINEVSYSHIINPVNGSAKNQYDDVIVLSKEGYLGDILSTSMMNNTIDEIKEIEQKCDVQCIVIQDDKMIYRNENIEVLHS